MIAIVDAILSAILKSLPGKWWKPFSMVGAFLTFLLYLLLFNDLGLRGLIVGFIVGLAAGIVLDIVLSK